MISSKIKRIQFWANLDNLNTKIIGHMQVHMITKFSQIKWFTIKLIHSVGDINVRVKVRVVAIHFVYCMFTWPLNAADRKLHQDIIDGKQTKRSHFDINIKYIVVHSEKLFSPG